MEITITAAATVPETWCFDVFIVVFSSASQPIGIETGQFKTREYVDWAPPRACGRVA
jgi:hypothetical protein